MRQKNMFHSTALRCNDKQWLDSPFYKDALFDITNVHLLNLLYVILSQKLKFDT